MSPAYRKLLKASRIAHVYLTLFGLVLILFFSVTGFMLNYEGWFLPPGKETALDPVAGTIPAGLMEPLNKYAVVEHLRRRFGASGFVGIDPKDQDPAEPFDLDAYFRKDNPDEPAEPYKLQFVKPGGRHVVEIKYEPGRDATVEVVEYRSGWAGIAMDLHKGKASGPAWKWVINVTCALLLLISVTGLVLWSSLRTRGKWGMLLLVLGGLAGLAVYVFGVP